MNLPALFISELLLGGSAFAKGKEIIYRDNSIVGPIIATIFGGVVIGGGISFIFSIFSKNQEKIESAWRDYWEIRNSREISPDPIKMYICFGIEIVLIKFFLIRCPFCLKRYFIESWISFNPMAEKCSHCGQSTKERFNENSRPKELAAKD